MTAQPAGVLRLLAEAVGALVRPRRAFTQIAADARPNYLQLVPLVALWGVPYALLHFRFMESQWMHLSWPLTPFVKARLLAFVSVSVMNWLLAGVVVALIARLVRRPMPQGRCDVAGTYLWMVWALMPLADSAALIGIRPWNIIFPFPREVPLIVIGHAAWFFAFPVLVVELLCCVRYLLGLSWGRGAGALLLAVFLVAAARLIAEPMPVWVARWLHGAGHRVDHWTLHAIMAWGTVLVVAAVRWRLARAPAAASQRTPGPRGRRSRLAATAVAAVAIWLPAGPAWAATRTWDGGGTDGTCGGAAGDGNKASCAANWSDDTAPVSGDDIVFNGTSTKNCTFNLALNGYSAALSWSQNAGYSGAVTLAADLIITNAFTLADGTFSTGTNYQLAPGSFSQSGGVFTANNSTITIVTSGFTRTSGTFTAGGSTLVLQGTGNLNDGGATLNNVTVSAGTQTLTAALDLSGALTISGGVLDTSGTSHYAITTGSYSQSSGTLTANNSAIASAGSFSHTGGTLTGGGSTVTLTGSGTLRSASGLYNLTVNASGTYTLNAPFSLTNTLTISSGTLDTDSNTVGAGFVVLNGGTLTADDSAITVSGASGTPWNKTSGTFTAGGSTVTLTGAGTLTSGGSSFNHLTINGSGTYTLGGALTTGGTLTLAGGVLDTSGTNYAVSAHTYTQTGGTFTANDSTVTVTTGDFTLAAGTYTAGTSDLVVTAGSFLNAGTFTKGTSTVTLQGSGKLLRSGGSAFYNLTLNASGTYTLDDALTVGTTFTLTAGTLDTNSYPVAFQFAYSQGGGVFLANASTITSDGSFIITAGTFTAGTSTLQFTNSVSTTLTTGGQSLYNLTVSTSTVTLGSALTVTNALTLDNGLLNTSGTSHYAVTTGSYTQTAGTFTANNSTITITSGNFTKTAGGFTAGGSTLKFTGSGAQAFTPGGSAYYNVTLDKASGSVTLGGNLTVSNVLTLTQGDLAASSYTLFLDKSGTGASRPLIVSSGTFTAGTSTVIHRGSSTTEVAPLTYYNLVIDQPGVQYNFVAGSTTTVSARLVLLGSSGSNMTLRSSSGGSQATLDPPGTVAASFLDVQDINSCNDGVTAYNSTGSGNGCWTFATVITWDGGGSTNNASEGANWSGNTAPTTGNSILFDATSTKNCTFDINLGGYEFGTFTVASTYSGTITLSTGLSMSASLFSLAAGTFDTGNQPMVVGHFKQTGGTFTNGSSDLSVYGSFNVTAGTFTAGTGILYLYGLPRLNSGGNTLNSVQIYNGSYTLAGALTVTNELAIHDTALDTSTSNYALTVGSYTQNDSGTLTLNGSTMTVNSGDFHLYAGSLVAGASSLNFTSGTAQAFSPNGASFYIVRVLKTGNSTLTLAGDLSIEQNLVLNTGAILNASSYRINLDRSVTGASKPFVISGGTFTPGTGTVAYRGSGITEITATTYYNLEVEQPGAQFNFTSSTTTTVTNSLVLRGSSDQPMLLRTSSGSTAATLDPPEAQTVEYVDVAYNNADAAADACATNAVTAYNSTDSLNNTCWTFSTTRSRQGTGVGYPSIH